MKAFTKSIKFIGASLVFLALAACGKSDNNNNVAAVQYGYVNGQCYDVTHNTPASYNLCTGVGTTGQYQYINNQCVSTVNNQVVDPTYCQQSMQYGYGGAGGCGVPGYAYPMGQGYASYWGTNTYPSTCGGGTYGGTMSCAGRQMYAYNGYTAQLIYCDAYTCRGQFLYDVNTRVRVYCQ